MTTQLYDIPLNGYHIFDYMGDEAFEHKMKDKKAREAIFDIFIEELPCRISELQKLLKDVTVLDYSYSSMEKIDQWVWKIAMNHKKKHFKLTKEIEMLDELYVINKDHFHDKYGLIQDVMLRREFPALYRSTTTDLSIYFAECLRRRNVVKDVRWIAGHAGNKYQGGGHPRLLWKYDKRSKHTDHLSKDGEWILVYDIAQSISACISHLDEFSDFFLRQKFWCAMGTEPRVPPPTELLEAKF